MSHLALLACKLYQVPEIHELIGFVYWCATGKFLS
jgi:hypothetical protein